MLRKLPFPICLCALSIQSAIATMEFDLSALELDSDIQISLDADRLRSVDKQLPGVYLVDIYVNGLRIKNSEVYFSVCDEKLCPEFTKRRLDEFGVNVDGNTNLRNLNDDAKVSFPTALLPDSHAVLDTKHQRLDLTVPQKLMKTTIRNDVPVTDWDNGLPAFFTSWNVSGQHASFHNGNSGYENYANLQSGLNAGGWRIRNFSYLLHNKEQQEWNSLQTYVSHDIPAWRSQVYLGQHSTSGRVFDAFNFKGIKLESNSQMLPDSQRGYAPVVKGIAFTQARVEVRQKGNLIYQSFIPPGPFEITDLFPTANGGDLEVEIQEADGRVRQYVQPFASVPMMVRENQLKYGLTAGKYDNSSMRQDAFIQAEFLFGALNSTTIYGGMLHAEPYQHTVAGIGQGLGMLGSVSGDYQISNVRKGSDNIGRGKAWQLQYQKIFDETNTTLSFSYINYRDRQFRTFEQFENEFVSFDQKEFYQQQDIRHRYQLSLSQGLGDYGSLSLNGFRQTGFKKESNNDNLNASYSFTVSSVSVSLSMQKSNSSFGNHTRENLYSINLSMPIGSLFSKGRYNSSQMNYGMAKSDSGMIQHQTSLSGTLLRENNLSYAVSQNTSRNQRGEKWVTSESGQIKFDGRYGGASLGYAQTDGDNRRVNYGVSGSMLVHPFGFTFGQEIGQKNAALALIQAPGVGDVSVTNKWGVSTNSAGYALVPYLQPYRYNDIQLDPQTLPDDAELNTTAIRQVPTDGAVLLSSFKTSVGAKAYIQLKHNGQTLPFGTQVTTSDGGQGLVDDRGYAWISGLQSNSILMASSGEQKCQAAINLDLLVKTHGVYKGILTCH